MSVLLNYIAKILNKNFLSTSSVMDLENVKHIVLIFLVYGVQFSVVFLIFHHFGSSAFKISLNVKT